jgi:hypothetical protein
MFRRAAIGATYDESVLVVTTLFPTEASWDRRKDREVVCVAITWTWTS